MLRRIFIITFVAITAALRLYGSEHPPSFSPKDGKSLGGQALWFTKTGGNNYGGNHYKEYIQLSPGMDPILFYEHDRVIEPILGHHQRLLLINDVFAVGGCNVYVMDLKNLRKWRIDQPAIHQHDGLYSGLLKRLGGEPLPPDYPFRNAYKIGLAYAVQGRAFSPGDDQALLSIISGPVINTEILSHPENYVKEWSYVVDVKRGGKILKVYQTSKVPDHWWVEEQ